MFRKTFLVNGRGMDVEGIYSENLTENEDDAYYKVSGVGIKATLLFSGPPNHHLRVLEHALAKWYELGEIDEGLLNWPTDRMIEI